MYFVVVVNLKKISLYPNGLYLHIRRVILNRYTCRLSQSDCKKLGQDRTNGNDDDVNCDVSDSLSYSLANQRVGN